jgi:hypothetical protein
MSIEDTSALDWLMNWYADQCDGDWEHYTGIRIETIDNPGWRLRIPVWGTAYENATLALTKREVDDFDWTHCRIHEGFFEGHGGPKNLKDLIEKFREVITSQEAM